MSKLDDERRQRTEANRKARIEALTNVLKLSGNAPTGGEGHALAEVLDEIKNQIHLYADLMAENKAAGWKSQQAVYLKAAPLFGEWAEEFRKALPPLESRPDIADPTPLRDIQPGDVTQDVAPPAATSDDIEAYLRGETDTCPDLAGTPTDPGPNIGGYVTPAAAEQIRAEIEAAVAADLDANPDMAHVYEMTEAEEAKPVQVPEMVEVPSPFPVEANASYSVSGSQVTGPLPIPVMVEPPTTVRRPRLTYPQFLQIAMAAPDPEHWSHSAVATYAQCGGKYVMRKQERPMWAGVGGTAFHKFVELLERARHSGIGSTTEVDATWEQCFAEAIAATEAEHPEFPRASWYVANRGRENEDWWRVEGLEMCRTYVLTSDPTNGTGANSNGAPEMKLPLAPGRDGNPMIELDITVTVAGKPFQAILDQVRYEHSVPRLVIVDPKTSSRKPEDGGAQLREYAHVLAAKYGIADDYRIDGAYYMARTGTTVLYENLRAQEDWAGFEYRVGTAIRKRQAHIYDFNPSSLCSACGNNDRCPANGGMPS